MQIISGRQFLFEKEAYHQNETTNERVRVVETSLTVRAIPQAQVVPEWVGETDLFKQAVKDGTIVEVEIQGAAPKFSVDNESKAGVSGGAAQNFAPLANGAEQGQQKDQQQGQQAGLSQGQQQTGWGK